MCLFVCLLFMRWYEVYGLSMLIPRPSEINRIYGFWVFIRVLSITHLPEASAPSFRLRHVGWALIVRDSVDVFSVKSTSGFGCYHTQRCAFRMQREGRLVRIPSSLFRYWFLLVCMFAQYIKWESLYKITSIQPSGRVDAECGLL